MRTGGVALVALIATAAAGCAKNPDAIAPVAMPMNAYSGLSCEQLAMEHRRSSSALAAVSQQQKQAATGDAVGVFLIGVPVSSLSGGDKEGLVAQHKGEIVAIEGAMRAGRCAVAAPSGTVAAAAAASVPSPAPRPAASAPAPGPVRAAQ